MTLSITRTPDEGGCRHTACLRNSTPKHPGWARVLSLDSPQQFCSVIYFWGGVTSFSTKVSIPSRIGSRDALCAQSLCACAPRLPPGKCSTSLRNKRGTLPTRANNGCAPNASSSTSPRNTACSRHCLWELPSAVLLVNRDRRWNRLGYRSESHSSCVMTCSEFLVIPPSPVNRVAMTCARESARCLSPSLAKNLAPVLAASSMNSSVILPSHRCRLTHCSAQSSTAVQWGRLRPSSPPMFEKPNPLSPSHRSARRLLQNCERLPTPSPGEYGSPGRNQPSGSHPGPRRPVRTAPWPLSQGLRDPPNFSLYPTNHH